MRVRSRNFSSWSWQVRIPTRYTGRPAAGRAEGMSAKSLRIEANGSPVGNCMGSPHTAGYIAENLPADARSFSPSFNIRNLRQNIQELEE